MVQTGKAYMALKKASLICAGIGILQTMPETMSRYPCFRGTLEFCMEATCYTAYKSTESVEPSDFLV